MAKQAGKKSSSTGRNSDRKNGKAWKKNPKTNKKPVTEARSLRNMEIIVARATRKQNRLDELARQRAVAILEQQRKESEAARIEALPADLQWVAKKLVSA